MSYTHGTTTFKKDVASESRDSYATSPALMYASAGYAVAMPDYVGLGKGPGVHPWMHMATQTSASLDMLRAAREFAVDKGRTLERKVYVTGFSQGASCALGLARALQDGQDSWFDLEAVAPISGAYDFAGTELPALLEGRLEPRSSVA
ncbi:MAG: lipase family protein [Actinomycetota bacterium]|nr:lipase family protein [Actinomycetota bacterium]